MKMIHLVIDEKPVMVPEGTNIFQAALDNDIYIPGLCYHPKLSQFGGCRLCYVEVSERKRTRSRFACAHPVSEGMAVKVNTPEVLRYRKAVMEYLLAHHELACPTCDKSGECGLQNITHELNMYPGRFKTVRMDAPVIRDNPILELNRNRCILCGRCVSACKELEGVGSIDFQNRGIKTVIGTAFNRPLSCSFCGSCVEVCPTGAWQDRTLHFRGRPWEFQRVSSICTYCAVGCTVIINTKAGCVRRVTSNDSAGINNGNLCVKGRFGHEFIHSEERIKSPLIRKEGVLQPVSWDEAINHVTKKLREIIEKHGGTSIGGIGSEKCTNEENYLFQKFCRTVLKTNNIDNISNVKSPLLNDFIYDSANMGILPSSLKEIERADTLFFFGVDVTEAHPVVGNMARKAIRLNGANLVIANARNVIFNSMAKKDIRLRYTLGTQTVLIQALIKCIIDRKLVDLNQLEKKTTNFNQLQASLIKLNLKTVCKQTGVPDDLLNETAEILTKPGKCYIICGRDIESDSLASESLHSLKNLCIMLNAAHSTIDVNPGKASLIFSRTHNNSQGVNDMGVVPGYFPGYLDINDQKNREKVEKLWETKLEGGVIHKESSNIFDLVMNGKLKALYIMGENPIVSNYHGDGLKQAFKHIDFILVQDSFLTETAQLADVILPTVTFAEKEGTFTNMGLTVQRVNKAIQPVAGSRSDWEIICDIAKNMGIPYTYKSSNDILVEIENITPIYSGINFDRLKRKEYNWPSFLATKNNSSSYAFHVVSSKTIDIKSVKSKQIPLILLVGSSLSHLGTYSRYSNALTAIASEGVIELNERDAKKMRIQDGDTVTVESALNKIRQKVKISKKSPEGIVFAPEDFENSPINFLRDNVYTAVKIYKDAG